MSNTKIKIEVKIGSASVTVEAENITTQEHRLELIRAVLDNSHKTTKP